MAKISDRDLMWIKEGLACGYRVYRAAVYTSDDGQGEIVLTGWDDRGLPDDELLSLGEKELAATYEGLDAENISTQFWRG